jgi:alpha-ketoglutarate-dependent taurine dioxygenase
MDMRQSTLIEIGATPTNFTVVTLSLGKIPEGLEPETIQKLWTLCATKGKQEQNQFRLKQRLPDRNDYSVEITHANETEGKHLLQIRKRQTIDPEQGFSVFRLSTNVIVLWDNQVTATTANDFVEEYSSIEQ